MCLLLYSGRFCAEASLCIVAGFIIKAFIFNTVLVNERAQTHVCPLIKVISVQISIPPRINVVRFTLFITL